MQDLYGNNVGDVTAVDEQSELTDGCEVVRAKRVRQSHSTWDRLTLQEKEDIKKKAREKRLKNAEYMIKLRNEIYRGRQKTIDDFRA